jgi:hypothetical protein
MGGPYRGDLMATHPLATAVETFAAPIESLIIALGQGLAQAQQGLDQNSIQAQEAIDTDPGTATTLHP